jgi:hypothetical protein
MTFLVFIEYQNFTRIHTEEIIQQVLILFEDRKLFINMSNMLTAVKQGIQSYWTTSISVVPYLGLHNAQDFAQIL